MTNKPKNCDNCARCCTWEAEVYSEDNVPEDMKELVVENLWMMKRNPKSNACIALDVNTLRCSIYHRRPTQCKEFEVGGKFCLDARRCSSVKILS